MALNKRTKSVLAYAAAGLLIGCSGASIVKTRSGSQSDPASAVESDASADSANSSLPASVTGTNLTMEVKQTCTTSDCLTVEFAGVVYKNGKFSFVLGDSNSSKDQVTSFKWQVLSESIDVSCDSTSGERVARPRCSSSEASVLNRVHTSLVATLKDGTTVGAGSDASYGLPSSSAALWLDSDDLAASAGLTNQLSITDWKSKGEYKYAMHSMPANASRPLPAVVQGGLNGHGYLSFDGTNHDMVMDAQSSSIPVQDAYSVAIVYRSHDLESYNHQNHIFTKFLACSANEFILGNGYNSAYSQATAQYDTILSPRQNSEWKIMVATYAANSKIGLYLDGQTGETKPISFTLNGTTEPFKLAGTDVSFCSQPSNVATRYSKVDIAEVLLYTRYFTPAERKQTECYLARKYKLAGPSGC